MKKQNLIIITILVIGIGTVILSYFLQTPQQSKFYPEPNWVTDIKNKVDLDKCGSTNCEACDKEKCLEYPDSCKVTSARYACGPACDAAIIFCINSGPAETGMDTYCDSDNDCWCRAFTGAQFIPGERVPHICNLNTNRCEPCYYE
ncbi:hypothetical protein J4448_02415 [Candidatus Woesearchaeota archaeon]|nr:hypothetical protein [Candidatus Woesearchaeota archaeon]